MVNLLDHVILTRHQAEFVGVVVVVLIRDDAGFTRCAVTALSHWRANTTVVESTTSVDGAGLISHFVLGHPLVSGGGVATVAAQRGVHAVDEDLGSDVDVGPGGVSGNLYSV